MPDIKFVKNIENARVEKGTNLMKALLSAGRPVASSCHGEGVCSKCRIRVVEGAENLSAETDFEKTLRTRNRVADDYRISCQTTVNGDVALDTPYW